MLTLINNYIHGLVVVPVIDACKKRKMFEVLARAGGASLSDAAILLGANEGHLNNALHILLSLGWVTKDNNARFYLSDKSEHEEIPLDSSKLLSIPFAEYLEPSNAHHISLEQWFSKIKARWGTSNEDVANYLDGCLLIPLLLRMKSSGMFDCNNKNKTGVPCFIENDFPARDEILDLFLFLGWCKNDEIPSLTVVGQYIVDRIFIAASAASYMPMFRQIEEVIFGDCTSVFRRDKDGHESHIDRTLNVLGSGFQHQKYFSDMEQAVITLFDQEPIENQPRYIADMGCGDGQMLYQLHKVITTKTRRGKCLESFPLTLIGIDYNEKSLRETCATLKNMDFRTIKGDIGDPQSLIKDLIEEGIVDVENILHVRSFLDHDRPFIAPRQELCAYSFLAGGIYTADDGSVICPSNAFQSLSEHFYRWSCIPSRFGMLILEVHSLAAATVEQFKNDTESLHFDAHQRFSSQYLAPACDFVAAAANVGLMPNVPLAKKYPKVFPFTRITLNYFKKMPWIFRVVNDDDIKQLSTLEEGLSLGDIGLLNSHGHHVAIEDRVKSFAQGQWVATHDDKIVAVLYSQRRTDAQTNQAAEFRWRHSASGNTVELLYSIYCEEGNAQACRELIEFVAYYSSLIDGVEEVKVSSRCSHPMAASGSVAKIEDADKPEYQAAIVSAIVSFIAKSKLEEDADLIFEQRLGDLGARWLMKIFNNLGIFTNLGDTYSSISSVLEQAGILSKYQRLLENLILILVKNGALSITDSGYQVTHRYSELVLSEAATDASHLRRETCAIFPQYESMIALVFTCLENFEDVLLGKIDATEVVFPGGSMDQFSGIFKGNDIADFFNDLMSESILQSVSRLIEKPLDDSGKLEILEIGAGTGTATASVLEKVAAYEENITLHYTDISGTFTRHGKNLFQDRYKFTKYARLDITLDPQSQGIEPHSIDIAYASNVLHDTPDIACTLENIKTLLKPGGVVIINEYTAVKDILLLTGGLLHGPWLYTDSESRVENACFLSASQWRLAFERAGFEHSYAYGLPFYNSESEFRQSVIIAFSPLIYEIKKGAKAQDSEASRGTLKASPQNEEATRLSAGEQNITTKVWQALSALLESDRLALMDEKMPFMEFGMDSMEMVEFKALLSKSFKCQLGAQFLFEYTNVEKVVKYFLTLGISQDRLNGGNDGAQPPQPMPLIKPVEKTNTDHAIGLGQQSNEVFQKISTSLIKILGRSRWDRFDPDCPIMEAGLDSLEMLEFKALLSKTMGLTLPATFLFEHNTLEKIANYFSGGDFREKDTTKGRSQLALVERNRQVSSSTKNSDDSGHNQNKNKSVAIIGMSFVLPGDIRNRRDFWTALKDGKSLITELPKSRWRWPTDSNVEQSPWLQRGGFLQEIDVFDAQFFRVSRREAEMMDPQQRMLLELSWEAIENAGYRPSELKDSSTGVYIGACHFDYVSLLRLNGRAREALSTTGTLNSVLANRISYFYDFKGPSLVIDTACSSSLVAVVTAVEDIRAGRVDQAIVGGINLMCDPTTTLAYNDAGMLSRHGRCATFDKSADGYVRSEGGAVVVLKDSLRAKEDGDRIFAHICGVAVNHGGQASSLTAPNPKSQAELIKSAWRNGEIEGSTVGYIETHGTGTPLGDPIEVSGICAAYRDQSQQNGCFLGSLKSNVGHLEAAAGIAGLIKTILCFENKAIPPNANFNSLNPEISLDKTVKVSKTLFRWRARKNSQGEYLPRRAGISSFGFGGSNAHIVVEEAEEIHPSSRVESRATAQAVILSARSSEDLRSYAVKFLDRLECSHEWQGSNIENLENIAFSTQTCREPMRFRVGILTDSIDELADLLERFISEHPALDNSLLAGAVATMDDARHEAGTLFSMCQKWVDGENVDWLSLYSNSTRPAKVELPTYPFKRDKYWFEEPKLVAGEQNPLIRTGNYRERTTEFSDHLVEKSQEYLIAETLDDLKRVVEKLARCSHDFIDNKDVIQNRPISSKAKYRKSTEDNPQLLTYPSGSSGSASTSSKSSVKLDHPENYMIKNSYSPSVEDFRKEGFSGKGDHLNSNWSREAIVEALKTSIAKFLYVEGSKVSEDITFVEMGVDSITGVSWIRDVNKKFNVNLTATKLYDFPTIKLFSENLYEMVSSKSGNADSHNLLTVAKVYDSPLLASSDTASNLVELSPASSIDFSFNKDHPAVLSQPEIRASNSNKVPFAEDWSKDSILGKLKSSIAKFLYVSDDDIDENKSFVEMGVDSIIGVSWIREVNKQFGISLTATKIYDFPSLGLFAEHLYSTFSSKAIDDSSRIHSSDKRQDNRSTPNVSTIKKGSIELSSTSSMHYGYGGDRPFKNSSVNFSKEPVERIAFADERKVVTDDNNYEISLEELKSSIAKFLYIDSSEIDENKNFVDLGVDSIIGVAWIKEVNADFGVRITASKLYDYPCIAQFYKYLCSLVKENKLVKDNTHVSETNFERAKTGIGNDVIREILDDVMKGNIDEQQAEKMIAALER